MQLNSDEYLEDLIKRRDYETKRKRIEKIKMASYPTLWIGISGLYIFAAKQIINYNKPYLIGVSVLAGLIAIINVTLYIKERVNNLKSIIEKEEDLNKAIRNEIDNICDKRYSKAVNVENRIDYLQEKLKLYNKYKVKTEKDNIMLEKKLKS